MEYLDGVEKFEDDNPTRVRASRNITINTKIPQFNPNEFGSSSLEDDDDGDNEN